jgi:hypothetical protein
MRGQEIFRVYVQMKYQTGGKQAVERVMEAYGFRFRNDLCRQLDISSSTLSTWLRRDYLPGEVLIQCSVETRASIEWLATGVGVAFESAHSDVLHLQSYFLADGQLTRDSKVLFDRVLLPPNIGQPFAIKHTDQTYLLDSGFGEFSDGEWLVKIDDKTSIREVAFIPGKRVKVNGSVPFECAAADIELVARVVGVFLRK